MQTKWNIRVLCYESINLVCLYEKKKRIIPFLEYRSNQHNLIFEIISNLARHSMAAAIVATAASAAAEVMARRAFLNTHIFHAKNYTIYIHLQLSHPLNPSTMMRCILLPSTGECGRFKRDNRDFICRAHELKL